MAIATTSIQLVVHDSLTNTGNEETFFQDFLELIENLEEMSPHYYIHSDVCCSTKSATTQWCLTRRKEDNLFGTCDCSCNVHEIIPS